MQRMLLLSMLLIPFLTLETPVHASLSSIAERHPQAAEISLQASEDAAYRTTMKLQDDRWERWFSRHAVPEKIMHVPLSDAYLTLNLRHGQTRRLLVERDGNLIDIASLVRYRPPASLRQELLQHITELRGRHYGSLQPWDVMDRMFPKKDRFIVKDLETGLSFRVQRRAGSSHADVQPLTKGDTEIMFRIYDGRWSWKRRAILIGHEDDGVNGQRWMAASMHGMPHGGDGIPDNDFAGHFCIHAKDSRTHGRRNLDFDHQLMVWKAAGELPSFFDAASPRELVHSFFSSLNQQDKVLLAWCFAYRNHPQLPFFLSEMMRIASIHTRLPQKLDDSFRHILAAEVQIEAVVYRAGEGQDRVIYSFLISRDTLASRWKIESITLVS